MFSKPNVIRKVLISYLQVHLLI